MKQKAHRQAGFLLRPIESVRFAAASRVLVPLMVIIALSACSSQPIAGPPVFITQRTYIPAPLTLTAPTTVNLGDNPTWGSALGSYKAGLDSCNIDKGAIAGLKPPSDTAPP